MIFETIILTWLAKLGCILTAVKITKRKKQIGEVMKKEKSRWGRRVKRKRLSQAPPGNPEKINMWDWIRDKFHKSN